jgi:hypothetical protein
MQIEAPLAPELKSFLAAISVGSYPD